MPGLFASLFSRAAAAALVFSLAAASAQAAARGPFAPFLGEWSGAGTIHGSNGSQEPIKCRATYNGEDGDASFTQTLVCASDSFRLNIEASAQLDGGQLRGQWRETTRGVQGSLSGQIDRGDFEGTVDGGAFTAQLSIRSNGKRQAVRIQPSAGDVQSVEITLAKRR